MGLNSQNGSISNGEVVEFEPESISVYDRPGFDASLADRVSYDSLIKGLKNANSLDLGVNNLSTVIEVLGIMSVTAQDLNNQITDWINQSYKPVVTTGSFVFSSNVGVGLSSVSGRVSFGNQLADIYNASSRNDIGIFTYVTEAQGLSVGQQYNLLGNYSASIQTYVGVGNYSGQLKTFTSLNTGASFLTDIPQEKCSIYAGREGNLTKVYIDGVLSNTQTRATSGDPSGSFAFLNLAGLNNYGFTGKIGVYMIVKASAWNPSAAHTVVKNWLLSRGVTGI